MPQRNEALSLLNGFSVLVSMPSGHPVKAIRVDNGTEYGNIQ
jgi:phosphoribosylcarboxyaminoimidazole (NCAIR) mutase